MAPDRKKALLGEIGIALGLTRAWRLVILSALGLVLILGVLVILVGVFVSGSATLDDIGVPAGITALLAPMLAIGLAVGVMRVRALGQHELLRALQVDPPAIARVERVADGYFAGLRFQLPSGAQYTIWLDPRSVDELARWLGGWSLQSRGAVMLRAVTRHDRKAARLRVVDEGAHPVGVAGARRTLDPIPRLPGDVHSLAPARTRGAGRSMCVAL